MANTKKKSSRPANRKLTKAQMEARAARQRRDKQRRIIAAVLIVAVVGGLVAVGISTAGGKNQTAAPLAAAPDPNVNCKPDDRFDSTTEDGPHVKKAPVYEIIPPSGGDHFDAAAAPGIYDSSGAPDDANIVHSLEHGYIAIWHRPDISTAELAKIENLWKNYKLDVLVVAKPSLPASTPVVATAWHHRLVCSGADDFQLNNFVEAFANQGPGEGPPQRRAHGGAIRGPNTSR